jgi:phage anti-repressor protein
MGVGRDFSTWITDRIKEYEFVEGTDFILCSPNLSSKECGVGSNGRGGHNTKDYYLSLKMAKELSMLQNNEQGRQARKYFIKCEEQLIGRHGRNKRRLCSNQSLPPDPQRRKDGYVNATAMCKAAGKRMTHYLENDTTRAFVVELAAVAGIPATDIFITKQGGIPQEQGTWLHPDAAVHFGQWLSPRFALAVSRWVREWMSGKDQTPIMTDHNLPLDPPLYPATIVGQDLATLFQVQSPEDFCIDLRTLHAAMGVGRMFSGWITARIEELGFVVGTDYIVCYPVSDSKECGVVSSGRGGHNAKEYLGTARTASHLGMAEKNERGRQVRNFFFNVAQVAATTQVQHQLPQTYVESLRALLISKEAEEAALKAKIAAEGHAKMMLQLASDAMDETKVAKEETRVVDEKLQVYGHQSPTNQDHQSRHQHPPIRTRAALAAWNHPPGCVILKLSAKAPTMGAWHATDELAPGLEGMAWPQSNVSPQHQPTSSRRQLQMPTDDN